MHKSESWFPGGALVTNLPASAVDTNDTGLIPLSGRSSEAGNSNLLQYSCLKISMDRGAWQATVHWGRKESDTTKQLSTHACSVCTALWTLSSQ